MIFPGLVIIKILYTLIIIIIKNILFKFVAPGGHVD